MRTIDETTWDRRRQFEHFKTFLNPFFAVTLQLDVSGVLNSFPRLAFGKMQDSRMNIAVSANHAFTDGYHVGLFAKKFQFYLNN